MTPVSPFTDKYTQNFMFMSISNFQVRQIFMGDTLRWLGDEFDSTMKVVLSFGC